jgi:hypothetical protein
MNLRSLASSLHYRGEVEGKRQTYSIFESKDYFFVMSLSRSKRNAGNFNVVSADAVEYVARRFGGRQDVTAKAVLKGSRTPRYVSSSLDALNILYVLVASGRARIDARFQTRELHFNVKG